ncbi:branched-chain amino acid ABC transporter permease [Kaistia dalseonensis]|uniref:Branched-chain amino acid transport system permease protein n=1 Tax=Kaistia dalseonensis TaxID=410840 RepID=A0ABU0H7B6_9HYPH|nr:branched-chain amino acid ABC transporter permease [Kaistia dalseonensis]MCX5495610.1 branched-chain amino acid ABC transporter permease [Kaistia dalseonensis]MDQ0438203.1 branched-chain amino acid transport system permease protein [Kaistia dalseonensis]
MIWLETIANGIFLGGLYALIGLGLGFAFGVMRVVNVAQGDFIVAAAFIGLYLAPWVPINPILVIVPVAVIAFLIGIALQRLLINRVLGHDQIPQILLTFGVAIVLRNAMVAGFGANSQSIDVGAMRFLGFNLLGIRLGVLPAVILVIALLLFAALHLWLHRSRLGRLIRATADDYQVVQLQGVSYRRVFAIAMGIAMALSAVAGVLLAMRGSFTPYSGADRLLIAFEVVVIGGLGSFWGMFFGGMLLGITQLVALKLDPASGLMYGHIVFFIILILSPNGLAGAFRRVVLRK